MICAVAKDESENDDHQDESDLNSKNVAKNIDGGIRYMIQHILYKDQVKHLKEIQKWPLDPFFSEQLIEGGDEEEMELREKAKAILKQEKEREASKDGNGSDNESEGGGCYEYGQYHEDGYEDDENGIVYGNDEYDDYLVNMNRIAKMKIEDSSSDEDSD